MVTMRDFCLPEFDKNRIIKEHKNLVFDTPCRYDIILGTNFLSKSGIKINYETGFMEWFEGLLHLRDPSVINAKTFDDIEDALLIQQEDEIFGEDWLDSYATEILEAKYNPTDINDAVSNMDHLKDDQKEDLKVLLNKHKELLDRTLGVYPHKTFQIDIYSETVPVHSRAYPVPHIHLDTFKT